MSETFTRPNGKPYTPRKPPTVETYCDSDEREALVVFRTHDIPKALSLAGDRIDQLELDRSKALISWWRLVPWDENGWYDTTFVNDYERGVPCVVIPHE